MYYLIINEKNLTVEFAGERKAEADVYLRNKHLEAIDLAAEEVLHYSYSNYEELELLLDTPQKKKELKQLAGAFGAYDYRLYKIKDLDRGEFPLCDTEGYEFVVRKQEILEKMAKRF